MGTHKSNIQETINRYRMAGRNVSANQLNVSANQLNVSALLTLVISPCQYSHSTNSSDMFVSI